MVTGADKPDVDESSELVFIRLFVDDNCLDLLQPLVLSRCDGILLTPLVSFDGVLLHKESFFCNFLHSIAGVTVAVWLDMIEPTVVLDTVDAIIKETYTLEHKVGIVSRHKC